jgi:opacity protein-like surface antigen
MRFLSLIALSLMSLQFAAFSKAYGQEAESKEQHQSPGSYVNALLGPAIVTSGGDGTEFVFGGRVGTGIYRDRSGILSLGINVETLSRSQTLSGIKTDARWTVILAEIISRKAWGTGLYLGARLGLGIVNVNIRSRSNGLNLTASNSNFAWGPVVGYEFPLGSHFGLNIDFSWNTMSGGDLNFPRIGKLPYDSMSAVLIQGGVSYYW